LPDQQNIISAAGFDLIEVFASLSEIPFRCKGRAEALKRISQLGQQTMRLRATTLVYLDLEAKQLITVAATSQDQEFETSMTNQEYSLKSEHINFELFSKGEPIEKYDLHVNGQGVANPKIARKHGLRSLLSWPLFLNGEHIGYINSFSSTQNPFTESERQLLEIFARHADMAIEKFDHNQKLTQSLDLMNDLFQKLLSASTAEFLDSVAGNASKLLTAPVCVLWERDESAGHLRVVAATPNVDADYRLLTLELDDPRVQRHLEYNKVSYLSNIAKSRALYVHSDDAERRGWISLLSAPMWDDKKAIGSLDVYTTKTRHFREWEKELLGTFANHVALSLQNAQLLSETEKNVLHRKRLEKLPEVMLNMTKSDSKDEVLDMLLRGSMEIVGINNGWIRLLDYKTGYLTVTHQYGGGKLRPPLRIGEGIAGLSLEREEPIKADDLKDGSWDGIYRNYYDDARSELAIPILVNKAQVRVMREVKEGTKPIGVLIIESSVVAKFSDGDVQCLWPLARYAAIMIEKLEYDRKSNQLRQMGEKIVQERRVGYDQIIQTIVDQIKETLDFEYINLSVVIPEQHVIKSEHIVGISDDIIDEFKSMATHSLDGKDIQADIVKSKSIEVIAGIDQRFNQDIYKKFGHDNLIRAFVPLVISADRPAVGTVVAGYPRIHRKYIYEQDIQILKELVDYITQAVERKRTEALVSRVTHELRSPINGIRSHASLLSRRWPQFAPDEIKTKLEDILADCEILLHQAGILEYILGYTGRANVYEETYVFRDIILKILQQVVRPALISKRIPWTKVEYNPPDSARVIATIERVKINQVVYNLLMNSIKYAEDEPEEFRLKVEVEETKQHFIIKFMDWGMGVKEAYKDKIFDERFRTPEAVKKHVSGSGLGLTISKGIMKEMGGDLTLANLSKPTEFQLILPKRHRGGAQ